MHEQWFLVPLDFAEYEKVMQCYFNRNSFWNLCRFLWMHLRKDLPFDYICILAIQNLQYMAVSQQIRLCIEGLPLGSQQGLMDRGQSPIKHSESNSLLSPISYCSPYIPCCSFWLICQKLSIWKEFSHTHLLLVNDEWMMVKCCFYLILHVIVCNKHVIACISGCIIIAFTVKMYSVHV